MKSCGSSLNEACTCGEGFQLRMSPLARATKPWIGWGKKLTASQPPCTWNLANPPMYGWYSNVNPNVDNPRYSQATERRLGELRRRPTLMFNGYAEQIGNLYAGLDLKKNF